MVVGLGAIVAFFAILLGAGLGLAAWARWLGRRDGAPRFIRILAYVFVAIPVVIIAVDTWAIVSMRAIVAGDDPADRARLLAESIAELLNGAALAAPLYLLGACAMTFLTLRYRGP
jgi:hypothetical protein